jgi:hypothetical protein
MRVLFIVDDHVRTTSDGEITASLASTRIRLLLALKTLGEFGQDAKLAANTTPQAVLESPDFLDAETIVFGKVFQDYRDVVRRAKALGKVLIVDITDDPVQFELFHHIRQIITHCDGVIVPTARMADVSRAFLSKSALVARIEDPVEAEFAPPRARFRTAPERVELVWYGNPTNAAFLNAHVKSLEELGQTVPLRLTMVSTGFEVFDAFVGSHSEETGGPLVANFVEWSPAVQRQAITAADLVLLPGEPSGPSAPKSANRLISAIAGGRLAVASPLPAYQPFRAHAILVDNLANGISAALTLSAPGIEKRLAEGQEIIRSQYAPDLIGRKWVQTLATLTRQVRQAKGITN